MSSNADNDYDGPNPHELPVEARVYNKLVAMQKRISNLEIAKSALEELLAADTEQFDLMQKEIDRLKLEDSK